MKKILSLVLVVTILLSTLITSVIVLANNNDSAIKTTTIDLTQSLTDLFVTTGNTTSTTATVEGGKLNVTVSAYERQLSGITSFDSQTWFPNYMLAENGSRLVLTEGNKAIVEVKYKITGTPNVNHGTQIGIGNWNYGKGSNIYVRTSRKHTASDEGKEFTLSTAFTVDNKVATKIAFSGGGKIEISSIVVHELPAEHKDDYATVKFVDGDKETYEFVKKNETLKNPVEEDKTFEGWYSDSSFAGSAVTSVNADTTLYAKWFSSVPEDEAEIKTTTIDLTQSLTDLFVTTGNTAATTATVEGGKLNVTVSAYERQLSSITSFDSQTWFPNYMLAENGTRLVLTEGNKAIVEVNYKITGTPNANHGTQIGIGNWNYGKGSNIYVRTSRKHTASDEGKEFTLSTAFTVDNKVATKIAFSGGGKIEISSIVVHELPAKYINDYAVVKFVDGDKETYEFVKKNEPLKEPVKENDTFKGWYTSAAFTGSAVTSVSADTTLYAKWLGSAVDDSNIIKTTVIDLNQSLEDLFVTTGNTSNTTATVDSGKLKVSISAYERQLSSITSFDSQTWFPNYMLAENGSRLALTEGNKAIIEVKYKVTGLPNENHGTQIGIGNWNYGKGSNIYVRTYRKHTAADMGKEFTLATNFVVDNKVATKIAFSGGGQIEISSIVVHELPAKYINDYAVVKFIDGKSETNEFIKKNETLKELVKENDTFEGWYTSSALTGEAVTSVSADTTLYAKWATSVPGADNNIKTTVIDLSQSTENIFSTTGNTTSTTATVEGGKLKVNISAYERQLSGITSFDSQTWFPNYLLSENGILLAMANGSKAIVEVKYKVTAIPNVTHGTQIGIGNWVGGKGSNMHLRTFKKHTEADFGKEFTLTSTFIVDNKYSTKIAFSGGGEIVISSIVVHELPAEFIDDYAVVKFMDGNEQTTEFVKKNVSLKEPKKEFLSFGGWYEDKECTGQKVTAVNADATLYANWVVEKGYAVINFHSDDKIVTKKYKEGASINYKPTKTGFNFLGWYKYSNYVGRPSKTADSGLYNLYDKWEEKNPDVSVDVDITKNDKLITTTKTAESNSKLDKNKLVVNIHNYERQLDSTDTKTADSWFPSYYLYNSKGENVKLEIGTTYELEVTYKVIEVLAGDNVGIQIGFGADGQPNQTRTKIKGYAMHKSEDAGKEFTYSTSYTAEKFNFGKEHLPKLIFSGQGKLEILTVKIKKVLPIIKDTVIGTQNYEDYAIGTDVGVLGNKKGIEVSGDHNHTSGSKSKKSLKLNLNTNYLRLSGNTIISLKQDGELKPFAAEKGAAYRITFYLYADSDMSDITWSVNSVDEIMKNDYLSNFRMEVKDTVSLQKGKWKKITAYVPVLHGCYSSRSLIALAVASNGYDGKFVYIDDVTVEQLVDSEIVLYNSNGGEELIPQRAFSEQKIVSFKEPTKEGYLFDGWFYDSALKNEALTTDKFPKGKSEITLYAKWIEAPTKAYNFTAGSFDSEIYKKGIVPYENNVADMDSAIDGYNNKDMTQNVAWVKDAGIYANGTANVDGALAFDNALYSSYFDPEGYNAVKLMNEDGTPFTVVKGERYTLEFDYVFASYKGLSFIIPVISEHSAYKEIGYDSFQTLGRVSVMETDTDYLSYKQSFVAERTGYVYLTLTGRDDNANVDTHCYEKVYVDNVSIKNNPDVVKVELMNNNNLWFTKYGVKGEKFILSNLLKEGSDTFDGLYLDPEFKNKFSGKYPNKDTTLYIKLKKDTYDTPSDFSKPILLDFEETELLKDFYSQCKYVTTWSRETQNEWIFVTDDKENALSGSNYIKLNGFSHYWNQAKIALYDKNNPSNLMILDKGGKYRVTMMVRCEDIYEAPVNMTVSLENPASRFLLAENGNVKLEYDPTGDKKGYFKFVGDIEVSTEMEYLPSLAIRRNANDLQTIFIDTVKVEKLRDCTVKFEENGGTPIEDAVVQIHDLLYDPGIPYKDGYVFDGWYKDKGLTKIWDFDKDTVENDMVLYAKWSVEVLDEEMPEDNEPDQEDEPEYSAPEQKPEDNYSDNNQNNDSDDDYYDDMQSEDFEDDSEEEDFNDTEEETETEDNGNPPIFLDADEVNIKKTSGVNNGEESMPIWAIVLICVGSVVVLGSLGLITAIIIRKKNKKSN